MEKNAIGFLLAVRSLIGAGTNELKNKIGRSR